MQPVWAGEKVWERAGFSQFKKQEPRHALTSLANKAQAQSLKNICLNHRALSSSSSLSEYSSSRNSNNSGKSIRKSASWSESPAHPLAWQSARCCSESLLVQVQQSCHSTLDTAVCSSRPCCKLKAKCSLYSSWRNNLIPRWGQCC